VVTALNVLAVAAAIVGAAVIVVFLLSRDD
jgi:hypothetical protein